MVLEQDPQTGEIYLRLPAPLSNIVLTAPRDDPSHPTYAADQETIVSALNDVAVYDWLESPPLPYERHHAETYVSTGAEQCRGFFAPSSSEEGETQWAAGCPFRDIREIEGSRSDVTTATKIGDIMIRRYCFHEMAPDSEEREAEVRRNDARAPGDEDLVWDVGFWLLPTAHRRGIVSAALQTIISDWAVPRMNVRVLKSSAFVGNHGSVGVFRKCGFELETTIEKGSVVLSEARGGGRRDIHVFKWERE